MEAVCLVACEISLGEKFELPVHTIRIDCMRRLMLAEAHDVKSSRDFLARGSEMQGCTSAQG